MKFLIIYIRLNLTNEFNVNFILFDASSAKAMDDTKVVQAIESIQ
jgi:hypothetical protein